MRTIEEKKDTELFSSCWCFSRIHSEFRQMLLNCIRCFWSHRSRKEGLDNAGWSGRSYIVLLVVLILSVDDGQMDGLSMLATNVFKTGCPNCDLVFTRLYSSLRQDDTEDIFLSLSSPLKPKRSSILTDRS